MARMSHRYPQELRERAVRLVAESRDEYESEWKTIESIAAKLGIGSTETLRKWVRKAEIDAGQRPGVTSQESAEVRRLRAENRELRRANEILKAAAGFFAAELDRPQR
jgi:transposase